MDIKTLIDVMVLFADSDSDKKELDSCEIVGNNEILQSVNSEIVVYC